MIDEKVLHEEIIKWCKSEIGRGNYEIDTVDMCAMFRNIIDRQPKVGEWIPISEMLPDEDNPVFIALAWESVDIGWYRNGEWFSEFCNYDPDYGVVAWMPLPKPYKESED